MKVIWMNDPREITMTDALREGLREEMLRDEKVFVMGEDVQRWGGPFGVEKGLWKEFGEERVRDTPISEAAFVGAGVGAATMGYRPIVDLHITDFSLVAMDQICNQMGKIRYMFGGKAQIPLKILSGMGGGMATAGHHSSILYSVFAHMAGIKCVVPSTPFDAKGLLKTTIRDNDPVMFFVHKMLLNFKGNVPNREYTIPFGEAEIKRQGKDITVVALSRMVHVALNVAEKLKDKCDIEVVDPRTIVPLDKKAIVESVKKTGKAIVIDEDYQRCGFASEVSAILADEAFDYLDAPIKRLATPNVPIPFSPPLERYITPDEEKLTKTIEQMLT